MSDWVVIAWKNQPDDRRSSFFLRRREPINTHYTPVKVNRHLPMTGVAFVAETRIGRVPVFDARLARHPYETFVRNLKASYRRSPFRGRRKPRTQFYVLKPYDWLLDQFGLEAICGTDMMVSPFYIPFS